MARQSTKYQPSKMSYEKMSTDGDDPQTDIAVKGCFGKKSKKNKKSKPLKAVRQFLFGHCDRMYELNSRYNTEPIVYYAKMSAAASGFGGFIFL